MIDYSKNESICFKCKEKIREGEPIDKASQEKHNSCFRCLLKYLIENYYEFKSHSRGECLEYLDLREYYQIIEKCEKDIKEVEDWAEQVLKKEAKVAR